MTEHETIWLQPWCDKCETESRGSSEGRLWCQDNVWDQCGLCERRPVKYVLAKKPKSAQTSRE